MTMSATLMRLAVLVFSAREGVVLARLSAVGASLRSMTAKVTARSTERPL